MPAGKNWKKKNNENDWITWRNELAILTRILKEIDLNINCPKKCLFMSMDDNQGFHPIL